MVLDLTKGMVLDLSKSDNVITKVAVGVNWGKIQKTKTVTEKVGGFFGFGGKEETKTVVVDQEDVDLDLSALLFDSRGTLLNTIYFGNLRGNGIKHTGDDLKGDSEQDDNDNETINIELSAVDSAVSKIVFVLVSFRGQDFGTLPYATINLYDNSTTKTKIANTVADISKDRNFAGKKSMVFAALDKKSSGWEYRIINEPTPKSRLQDLNDICARA